MNVSPAATKFLNIVVVGTHMTGGLEMRVLLTLALLIAGSVVIVSARRVDRRSWRPTIVGLGLLVLTAGGLSGANTYMRHHIHLCHEHGMDNCPPGHRATGGVDHEHFFGRW